LPWDSIQRNTLYNGIITRIEKFGAFVDIGAERPGMVHVSEMADGYVQSPSDVVKVGQAVEVRVIKLNKKNRQIDLTMKTPKEEVAKVAAPEAAEDENLPTAMELALRRARAMSERARVTVNREREREPEPRRRPMRNHDEDDDDMPMRRGR
jgi:predicted RNA-binding protein with RPS1 domain